MVSKIVIGYILIWGILTTAAVMHMPSRMPFFRILIANSLFPIQWLLLPITIIYRVLGVGVYFETSILVTEDELKKLSDELDADNPDDR